MSNALIGQTCQRIILQQFWHLGKLVTELNLLYFESSVGDCYSIFFDDENEEWAIRRETAIPHVPSLGDVEFFYPLVELPAQAGVRGKKIVSVQQRHESAGVDLIVSFENNHTLKLRYDFRSERESVEMTPGSDSSS